MKIVRRVISIRPYGLKARRSPLTAGDDNTGGFRRDTPQSAGTMATNDQYCPAGGNRTVDPRQDLSARL